MSFGAIGKLRCLADESVFWEYRLLERAASLSRHDIQEAERVRYMERILSYYVPNITFDIQSLRQAAEELKSKHRDSESDVLSMKADANDLEDLAIDEEDFTIKALPDNTTRTSAFRTVPV